MRGMMDGCPDPLVGDGTDLRAFPFTPVYRQRLFSSSFHARATDAEWRAGVTLWLKSWDQIPAGSLPDDDVELCRLAELGRDLRTWRKVKERALHGWKLCSDGRLYHDVVAEIVTEANQRKQSQRSRTENARLARLNRRSESATPAAVTSSVTEQTSSLLQTPNPSVTDTVSDPVTASNRQGHGKGQRSEQLPLADVSGAARMPEVDPLKFIFDHGVRLLVAAAVTDQGARAFLGKLRGRHGNEIVEQTIKDACAQIPPLSDPRAWLTKACESRSKHRKSVDIGEQNYADGWGEKAA